MEGPADAGSRQKNGVWTQWNKMRQLRTEYRYVKMCTLYRAGSDGYKQHQKNVPIRQFEVDV